MNAIDFLRKEHDKVRRMLADISDNSHRHETKLKMFNTLCHDLLRHEEMEHQVWYPHFRNNSLLKQEVRHLLSEEKNAEKAIRELDNIDTEQAWEVKFAKFKKAVEHHAYEEEHDLFPEVERILTKEELNTIGKKMSEFKH